MRMMRLRGVWTTNLAAILLGAGMFGSFILIPQLVRLPEVDRVRVRRHRHAGRPVPAAATVMMVVFSVDRRAAVEHGGAHACRYCSARRSSVALVPAPRLRPREQWEICSATALLGVGIGFAFSAMANRSSSPCPSEQTGVATGMNTIMRTIGGSLGATVSAVILTSSLAADGLPKERGFTLAFAVSGGRAGRCSPRRGRGSSRRNALVVSRMDRVLRLHR